MIMEDLIVKMTEFNAGDPKRIQHFLKVYEFAHVIGIREGLDPETLHILEMAAILHDIGIRPSEEKYGRCDGKLQEQEGPAYARAMLTELGLAAEDVETMDFSKFDMVHLTGITPALSKSARAASEVLNAQARKAGCFFSFDPNLRPQLWTSREEMANCINSHTDPTFSCLGSKRRNC